MTPQMFWKAALLISLMLTLPARAQQSDRTDGLRFLPDVENQFGSLAVRPDPMGFHIGTSPNPSSCKHYQAITRIDAPDGTPYFLVTRSGNTPNVPGPFDDLVCDDSPNESGNGTLIIFRMGSRDKNGERLRSNRLQRDANYEDTKPPVEDMAAPFYTFRSGGLAFRNGDSDTTRIYQHPGGMQLIGGVLAVAIERPRLLGPGCSFPTEECINYDRAPDRTLIMFLDVHNPEDPVFLSQFAPKDAAHEPLASAGVVAVAPLPDDPTTPEPDGRYLMMVTGGAATAVYFYRSNTADLKSPTLDWTLVDTWFADPGDVVFNEDACRADSTIQDVFCLSPDEQYLEQNWPSDGLNGFPHQTLQFVRERDINGTLYLAGSRGKFGSDDNSLDLYRVDCETPLCKSGEIKMKNVMTRHQSYFPNASGEQLVNFAAATGFYISPSGELIFYATEHDNDGPEGTVKAA